MTDQFHPGGQRLLGQHVVVGAEQRPDLLVETGAFGRFADLRRHDERPSGLPGHLHRVMRTLVGGHPAGEQQVTAGPGAGLVDLQVDAVTDDRRHHDVAEAAGTGARDRHDQRVPGDLGQRAVVRGPGVMDVEGRSSMPSVVTGRVLGPYRDGSRLRRLVAIR